MSLKKKKLLIPPFKIKKDKLNEKRSNFRKTSFINKKEEKEDTKNNESQEILSEKELSSEESLLKEEILLSEIESLEDLDAPIYQKLTINNKEALNTALSSIEIPKTRFIDHQVVTSKEPIEIKDIHDDFARELAFYKQGLEAASWGRYAILKEGMPFSRPLDYFAEMLKSDQHMQKIKDQLIQKEVEKKAIESSRKQRELRKIGKMVQIAKIQKRQQEKKDALDKIKNLKRKKKGNEELTIDDDFDLALEKANPSQKQKMTKRQKKDEKYGYGGKKRYKKSNDAKSTNDIKQSCSNNHNDSHISIIQTRLLQLSGFDTNSKEKYRCDSKNKYTYGLKNNLEHEYKSGLPYSFSISYETLHFNPTSLFVPTITDLLKSMSRNQKFNLFLGLFHFIIGCLIWNFEHAPVSSTTLGSIIMYDAISMIFMFFLNVYSNFEIWYTNTIKYPFGLKRVDVLGKFSIAVFLLYMTMNSFKKIIETSILDPFSKTNALKKSESTQILWNFSSEIIIISIIITIISIVQFNNHYHLAKDIFSSSRIFYTFLNPFHLKSLLPLFIFFFMTITSLSTINTIDKYISLLFQIPICILEYIVIKKLGRILILSFPSDSVQSCINELKKGTLIHSIELVNIWQPYFSFYIANFNITTKNNENMNFEIQEFINNVLYRQFGTIINNNKAENIWEINVSIEKI
ncbi:hypothetical protein PMAC_000726 [Pneumocystis sp. 'macacae']|nr:hypothetical protein PMAC_000726 [Pneumocystis sp. 'macacae']